MVMRTLSKEQKPFTGVITKNKKSPGGKSLSEAQLDNSSQDTIESRCLIEQQESKSLILFLL
jgi:hypothetical protein